MEQQSKQNERIMRTMRAWVVAESRSSWTAADDFRPVTFWRFGK